MLNYTICSIVKNEEKNIDRFLRSLSIFDCEIIILDTGSTDSTLEIASKYSCKIYHFDWINDFSVARNYAASLARNEWILFIDCDEFVEHCNPHELSSLASHNPKSLGLLERVNLVSSDNEKGAYTDRIPRFYNRNYFEYTGQIHEQLVAKDNSALSGFYIPLKVIHTGYLGTPEELSAKHNRNIGMLRERLKFSPSDCYYNFQMGQELYNLDKYSEALPFFEMALNQNLSSQNEYHRILIMGYCDCLLLSGQHAKALEVIQSFQKEFGNCSDFFYLLGLINFHNRKYLHAMSAFIEAKLLKNPHKEGTDTYLPTFYLAQINELMGNTKQAVQFYKECGELEIAQIKIQELENLK